MWSKDFPSCIICGGTKARMMARGECAVCYQKKYRASHVQPIAASKRRWYERFVRGTDRGKIAREQRHFDGKRDAVLKRDGYKCVKCGSNKSLVVHHKDGKGRSVDAPNNSMCNLQTFCRKCHINAHRQELLEVRRRNNFRRPKIGHYKRREKHHQERND